MESPDDRGWFRIHHAAHNGHISLVEHLVESSGSEILETPTADSAQNTALLLAASGGSLPLVSWLVGRGADVTYINRQQRGVVDFCADLGHRHLLRFFIDLHHQKLNVYKKLVERLDSDSAQDILGSCRLIEELSSQSEDLLEGFLGEDLPSRLVGVLQKSFGEVVKSTSLRLLKNLLTKACQDCAPSGAEGPGRGATDSENVPKHRGRKLLDKDGVKTLVSIIRSGSKPLLPEAIQCITQLASQKDSAEESSATIIPALEEVMSNAFQETQEEVLQPTLRAVGLLAAASPHCKDTIGKQSGLLGLLVKIFQLCPSQPLVTTWSEAVGRIAEGHQSNQNVLLAENVCRCLHQMLKTKNREVQMSAVETIHRLVEGNGPAGRRMAESSAFSSLIHLLRRSKSERAQEGMARAAWASAGGDPEAQGALAARIGVPVLVEFLTIPSPPLNLIGCSALVSLVRGPYDMRSSVMSANGAHPIVRLLRSEREDVVLSAIRTLQHVCLGVGFIPHSKLQSAVAEARGLDFLIALLRHSRSEWVQVESALAIAATVLGNVENLERIGRSSGFSYAFVLRLLRSSEEIRLTAGEAIAAFAFNGTSQQKEITQSGGVKWEDFCHFLESANQSERACAAFQLVVLAPIIPDKDPSYTCAVGIQTLIGLLETEQSNQTLALVADCVARLSHCRPGLAAAMVSIDVVSSLCRLLSSTSEQVKGSAAIALSFLSLNPVAERQLLKTCRYDLDLIRILVFYNKKRKWPESFLERWRHMRELALPPIRAPLPHSPT